LPENTSPVNSTLKTAVGDYLGRPMCLLLGCAFLKASLGA